MGIVKLCEDKPRYAKPRGDSRHNFTIQIDITIILQQSYLIFISIM